MTADEPYGQNPTFRTWLADRKVPFVLATRNDDVLTSPNGHRRQAKILATIAGIGDGGGWERRSIGRRGALGDRGVLPDRDDEAGLDQYQVRSWRAWHAHITLAMLTAAYLAATRVHEAEHQARSCCPTEAATAPTALTIHCPCSTNGLS